MIPFPPLSSTRRRPAAGFLLICDGTAEQKNDCIYEVKQKENLPKLWCTLDLFI